MKPSPKEQYDARQKLKRIARGEDPDEKTDEELLRDILYAFAERFISAVEGIEMNLRRPTQ